jgi:cytochrome c oxidase assembly protein subunit 15
MAHLREREVDYMVGGVLRKYPRMPETKSVPDQTRAVRLWLIVVAAMIFVTLAIGGATRLTQSGLSITEWKPISGVLPPMSEAAWQAEFKAYQAIPQYQQLNAGMSLGAFKVIYWWEWTHRLLARSVGIVFLGPFLFFLWRGTVPAGLHLRLWSIFAAGALLGVVGWWMVSSGLAGSGRVSVSQYRLAFHLTLAAAIYAAVLWTARQLAPQPASEAPLRARASAVAIAAMVMVQIYLGALVAGSGAGLAYNTWPLIDGAFVPAVDHLLFLRPEWRNFFENTLTVQFDHRMLAYAIVLAALAHAYDVRDRGAAILAAATVLQVALGVVTLLSQAQLALALAHQVLAVVVLTAAVVHAERLCHRARLPAQQLAGATP